MKAVVLPDREELAWAAGFFDGEGNFHLPRWHPPRTGISQADRQVLDRFRGAVVGIGTVYGPYPNKGRGCYQYHTYSLQNTQAVVAMLWAWLSGRKREQAVSILKGFKERRAVA